MDQRERLINLIIAALRGCSRHWAEVIADHLLANGVLVPPCKIGDTVYQTDGCRVYESVVENVIYDTDGIAFDETAIGHSIFLTRKEAEAKLKEEFHG